MGTNCTLAGATFASFSCADNSGPFGAQGIFAATRTRPVSAQRPTSLASSHKMALPPSHHTPIPSMAMFEQYNFDIQRQLPGGFFADVAYAGSHGVHLQQYSTHINQIGDSFVATAASQFNAALPGCSSDPNPIKCANGFVTIDQPVLQTPWPESPNPT